jgi:hypothetical protein
MPSSSTAGEMEHCPVILVAAWLGSIGLGHKKDIMLKEQMDGSLLLSVMAWDLYRPLDFWGCRFTKFRWPCLLSLPNPALSSNQPPTPVLLDPQNNLLLVDTSCPQKGIVELNAQVQQNP